MITLTGMKYGADNSAQITAFADSKEDVGGSMSIIGLPEGLTLSMGSAIFTAAGEVAFLKSDGTWNWVANAGGGGGGGASSFAELDDVALNNPSDGQVATYNGTSEKWENKAIPAELPSTPSGSATGYVLCLDGNKNPIWAPLNLELDSDRESIQLQINNDSVAEVFINDGILDIMLEDNEFQHRLVPDVTGIPLDGDTVIYCSPSTSNEWTAAKISVDPMDGSVSFDENI